MLTNSNNLNTATPRDFTPEISFDPESVIIEGLYPDELSAYRAKRVWIDTLESHFLLDEENDYLIAVSSEENEDLNSFYLRCQFTSACARYAFWRITNEQAPEAEYCLETAHIPVSNSSWLEFQSAPDMGDKYETEIWTDEDMEGEIPLHLNHETGEVSVNKHWFETFEEILGKIVTTFEKNKNDKS